MTEATVHFVGRLDLRDANGPRLAWAGTAIHARFVGTGIGLRVREAGNELGQPNQFQVRIDGAESRLRLEHGVEHYLLASGLPYGEHSIVVTRRTEALFGSVQFLGFSVEGGSLLVSPPPSGRHIELIGDSITNGYGNEAASAETPFSAETENECVAYGALTAAALGATHTAIAWSGRGLRINYADAREPTMPELFERALPYDAAPAWSFAACIPDAAVIYLGTNDTWSIADPGVEFTHAYVEFLTRLRAVYPAAPLFVAAAPERAHVVERAHAAVELRHAAGDRAVYAVTFEPYDSAEGKGSDHHPSAATHRRMAHTLTTVMRRTLGW